MYNSTAGSPATLTVLGSSSSPTETRLVSSTNVGTPFGFISARARTGTNTYEFQFVSYEPALNSGGQIGAYWNVSRDGVLVCTQCPGFFSGNSRGAGKPFTISVDNGNYKVVATLTAYTQI